MFQKSFLVLVLCALVTSSALAPKRAHAVVGLATANVPAMIVGGALLAVGGGLVLDAAIPRKPINPVGEVLRAFVGAVELLAGGTLGIAGLVVLDQEGSKEIAFSELSIEQATALSVTDESREVYNQELEELNAIKDSVASDLSGDQHPTIEKSAELWNSYKANLSPATLEVMGKVLSQK
ncbi:hypothetical protein WDW86_13785 [Bdellovibrionota bacterium FG-2]